MNTAHLLLVYRAYCVAHGKPPYLWELAHCACVSPSTARRGLLQLERAGEVTRTARKHRGTVEVSREELLRENARLRAELALVTGMRCGCRGEDER